MRRGAKADDLEDALNRRSGLLGLSGASADVRELLELERAQHGGAALALDAFCRRVRKYIGAYAAVLGGLDAVAFGGGTGENASVIRERILAPHGWLGIELYPSANAACTGTTARISTDGSRVDVYVVPVDEEPIIAQAMLDVLRAD